MVTSISATKALEKADATSLYEAILTSLDTYCGMETDDMSKKEIGFGSDGASVMTVCNNCVSAKLKLIQPMSQGIHCMAHRLELVLKYCFKLK